MHTLKKVTLVSLYLLFVSLCHAQVVKVEKETSRVKGENTNGYAVVLDGSKDEVNNALQKYLRSLGKTKQSDGMILLLESSLHGSNEKIPIYGLTREKGTSTLAWMGVKADEWPAGEADRINKELEKIAYEFGVKFYKDKIQVQIDESTQAMEAVEKQQQRLVNESRSLEQKMEYNQKEKVRLEKALENNKLEYEALIQRREKNKHDQDSVTAAGVQVKKVVEKHKERQGKVK